MSYGSLEEDGVEVYLEEGVQHLDGVQAEWFVRHRRSYAMGDLGRIQAQRNFFAGFAKKLMSLGMSDYVGLLPAVTENENVTTDMKGTELLGYAMNAKNLSVEDIKIFTLPGEGAWKDGVSYYSCHNDETVQLINEYFNPYMDKLTMKDVHFTELGQMCIRYRLMCTQKPVFKAHGNSSANAFKNAIRVSIDFAKGGVVDVITQNLSLIHI